jgi:hypothetical protein
MPRKSQNVQPSRVPQGRAYGQAQQMQQAMKAAPLPQIPGPPPAQANAGGPPPGNQPPAQAGGFAAALAAAARAPGIATSLTQPTMRPHEPVTTGLSQGMGAGPEVLNMSGTTVAEQARQLGTVMRDADLLAFAETAEAFGI